MVNHCLEADVHFLTYHQKAITSLTLCGNAYVIRPTSYHHPGILSSQVITRRRRVRIVREAMGEGDHIHMNFITIYCYKCSILLLVIAVNLLSCLFIR